MKREEIISFIEKIRPAIKEAGAPEEVLLKEATKANLAPAQLESTAQLLNTAQQLHFMDKSANRGDTFRLIDVPQLVSDYVQHKTPTKEASKSKPSARTFEKAATVTPPTVERFVDNNRVITTDTSLERPLTGKRIPNINQMALKDAGARDGYMSLGEQAEPLPVPERFRYKQARREQNAIAHEAVMLDQMIDDCKEDLRKAAEDIMYRIRTEPEFEWNKVKSDGLVISKEATEKASPVLENYFSKFTGHFKVAYSTEPAPQPGLLVEDRFNMIPTLEKIAALINGLEDITRYQAHIKESMMFPKSKTENESETDSSRDNKGGREPEKGKTENKEERDTYVQAPSTQGPLSWMEDVLMPPQQAKSPKERHDDLAKGVNDISHTIADGLDKMVPRPMDIPNEGLKILREISPGKNKGQKTIDDAMLDTKTVTTLERLMLTDPIIREADPDMVKTLFNTLQNANPEFTRDSNLLRFALREALQYESVPTHTYRDLVEIEERKSKARDSQKRLEDNRYTVRKD